jgi:hypothetical protein
MWRERAARAIRLKPDYAEVMENLAVLLDKLGRGSEARGFWEMAGKVDTRPAWVDRIKKRLAEPDWQEKIKQRLGEPK